MTSPKTLVALATALLCITVSKNSQATSTFTENFNGASISAHLVASSTAGYSMSLSAGQLLFQKAVGVGNGVASLTTDFDLIGDFTVAVDTSRTNVSNNAEAGLALSPFGTDIFFFGPSLINANIYIAPGFGSQTVGNNSSPVTFRIQRSGNTLTESFNAGAGFQVLHSATTVNASGPVPASIFLIQEFGNTAAHNVAFDNLSIVADAFSSPVPEPTPSVLLLTGGLLLLMGVSRRKL